MFELREALEPSVLVLVASRARPDAVARLRDELASPAAGSLEDAVTAEHALQTALADRSHNRHMARTMRLLLPNLLRILFLSLSGGGVRLDVARHHEALIEALLASDAAAARQSVVLESQELRTRIVEPIMTGLPDVSLQPSAAQAPAGTTAETGASTPAPRPSLRFS